MKALAIPLLVALVGCGQSGSSSGVTEERGDGTAAPVVVKVKSSTGPAVKVHKPKASVPRWASSTIAINTPATHSMKLPW